MKWMGGYGDTNCIIQLEELAQTDRVNTCERQRNTHAEHVCMETCMQWDNWESRLITQKGGKMYI